MSKPTCPCCSAREAALAYFRDHVGPGEVGDYVDGLLEAAARVAAAHILPGREADERRILVAAIGRRYDRALLAQASADAGDAVKH